MKLPKVTVLMPVYNAGGFLAEAIESILNQTFRDFELLIIDDGSTDRSLGTIKKYTKQDKRVKVVSHGENKGLVATLNEGIGLAEGKYIARQDQDDISAKSRLKKQVEYLDNNPSIGLLGTNYDVIDNRGKTVATTDVFTSPEDIKLAEVFSNQLGHGTIIARRRLLRTFPYDEDFKNAEDYDLWARLSHHTKIANLSKPLYKWRLHETGMTNTKTAAMQSQVHRIRNREFRYFLSHKSDFKIFSFHPRSMRGGTRSYLEKKSSVFRDMALMYCYTGLRRKAVPALLLALLYAPWNKKTYRQLIITLFRIKSMAMIDYEVI